MTNLDSILKSRDITLPTKLGLVKAMVFPVVMYGCESWTIMKAERWRIDAFEMWCWRRLLRVPWTAKRSNQSILKEISPEYSLEGLDAEAETQILWPPDANNWLIGKDPDAGKDWKKEKGTRKDEIIGWHHRLNGHEFGYTPGVGDGQGGVAARSPMGLQRVGHDWATELNWWTELVWDSWWLHILWVVNVLHVSYSNRPAMADQVVLMIISLIHKLSVYSYGY